MLIPRLALVAIALVCVLPVLAACGGDDSAAAEAGAAATEPSEAPPATEEEDVTKTSVASDDGPPPAAGLGTLTLADGRVFALAVSRCDPQPSGTFTVEGTGDEGATFEMTQLYLGDTWSRTQASLALAGGDQVYATASSAVDGAEPAVVEGRSVSWTQTFRELDESANSHVYTGAGTVRLTCP